MKTVYSKEKPELKGTEKAPHKLTDILDTPDAGNTVELELLRQELRERSDSLRNTTVRETSPQKLPGAGENGEYTAKINAGQKTIYLGSDKEEKTLLAAANPKGREASHRVERYEYASESSWCSVSSVLPKQREEFTLISSDRTDYGFIYTAAEDERLERDGEGQIRRASEDISSDNDEQTAGEIKEMRDGSTDKDAKLSGLDDLAQSVKQRSQSLVKQTEQQTQRILNRITAQQSSGDDFFDFLRRRDDDEYGLTDQIGGNEDIETEGATHEEDH